MIEKLIENWLINARERDYEVPFAQVLASEGHQIIMGPVHHPFEHGKDILTFDPNGDLHAYQLKGPDLVSIKAFERIQEQVQTLAEAAVTHPSLKVAKLPDGAFLVTNAKVTPAVSNRLEKINISLKQRGLPQIDLIERDRLLARFVKAHGNYLPQSLPEIRPLIELYYSDPESLFPVQKFAKFLENILPFSVNKVSKSDCRQAVTSLTLLTAYAAKSWTKKKNHLCVAQAWLTACITLMRFAAARTLDAQLWLNSYRLMLEEARVALRSLSKEAAHAEDLVVPSVAEGLIYSSRALLVSGFVSAYFLSERTLGDIDESTTNMVRAILTREVPHVEIVGESGVPALMITACALEQLGQIRTATSMMISLVRKLSSRNQQQSHDALADPYHDTEQVLLHRWGADSDLEWEQFDGRSYMLFVAIEWLARRLLRQDLAMMWNDITRVQFVEVQPSSPDQYLAVEDDDCELKTWFAGRPQSWANLLKGSKNLDHSRLPKILWDRREMIPFLPLLFPYRLTATLGHAIHEVAFRPKSST